MLSTSLFSVKQALRSRPLVCIIDLGRTHKTPRDHGLQSVCVTTNNLQQPHFDGPPWHRQEVKILFGLILQISLHTTSQLIT